MPSLRQSDRSIKEFTCTAPGRRPSWYLDFRTYLSIRRDRGFYQFFKQNRLNVGRAESDKEPPKLTHDVFRAVSCFSAIRQGDPSRSVGSDNELFTAVRTGSKNGFGPALEECRNYLLIIANRAAKESERS